MARDAGALVIYDEVITAFRFHYGAAQNFAAFPDHAAIEPDLTALGKIIGGGLPIGAYGGRADDHGAGRAARPRVSGRHDGRQPRFDLRRHRLPRRAARARRLRADGRARRPAARTALQAAAAKHGVPLTINRIRGAFSTHFCDHPVTNYEEAQDTDGEAFAAFFRAMLDRGICLAPSKYEAWFLTAAHTEADIEETIAAADESFRLVAAGAHG